MTFLFKPPKKTQVLSDRSFSPPPLDGTLTVPQLYDWHHKHNPTHPVFVHSGPDRKLQYYSFSQVVPAAHRAGRHIANVAGVDLTETPTINPVVAIVAASDTITYFTILVGILRAGLTVFPISPSYSAPIIGRLLWETHASHVFVSEEAHLHKLVQNAIHEIVQNHGHDSGPVICKMLKYQELYNESTLFEPLPPRVYDYSSPTIIVHSSGSTSTFPRPIRWNARRDLQTAICPSFSAHDLCGAVFGCQSLELYHGLGLCFVPWLAGTGLVMATFAPVTPAIAPEIDNVFESLVATTPSYVLVSPKFIQEWARDENKVKFLCGLKCLDLARAYAGSHLNKLVGDYLVKQGVRIYTIYGSTEAGSICQVFPEDIDIDWEYFKLNSHCAAEFNPRGDGTYDLVVLSKPTQELTFSNAKFHDLDAYATHDLFIPHPQKPGCWKILGRSEDQILLATGETTNPGPLEDILCQHPEVLAAVMFGRGRPNHGVLLELKKEYRFDPRDQHLLDEFRDRIWLKVDEMNTFAARHSRLSKEMVMVVRPEEPFIYNSKGLPKRAAILHKYQGDIDTLYNFRLGARV